MCIKTSVAVLLILSAALLTGCNVSYGSDCQPAQAAEENREMIVDEQEPTSNRTSAQLHEDLRLATERARLAEERAELEQQKRELIEERLKQPNETNEDNQVDEPVDEHETGGS